MNLQEGILRLGSLGSAIAELNRKMTSLNNAIEGVRRYTSVVDATSLVLIEKQDRYEEWQDQRKAEKNAVDADRLYMTEMRNLMNLVGKGGGAQLAYEHEVYTRRVDDIREAESKGILSSEQAEKASKELTDQYKDMTAEIEAHMSAGGFGAAMANFAAHPVQSVASPIGDQIGGIAQGLMGLTQGLPIAGGLFGLMMYGNAERDRMAAEAGEITNIISAATGKASKGAGTFFSSFQERAQKFLGISRQEVQANLRTFVDAGMTIDSIMAVHEKGLGEVGSNAVTLTLALDRHFEWGAGTSSRMAMQLVAERGNSLESAITQLTKLSFSAQRAGVGTLEFTETAVQGASDLAQFGVDAESVGAVLLTAVDRYREIGANPQLAFKTAQQGLTEFSEGIKRAPIGIKAAISSEMGLGGDLEGGMDLQDALDKGDKRSAMAFIQGASRLAKKQTRGTGGGSDETRERSWLETNFGFEGARLITELGGKTDKGKVKELDAKEWGALKDTFKTEAQKTSEIEKNKELILKGMASMGQALLALFANFAAMAIIAMKAMTSIDYVFEAGAWAAGKIFGDGAADVVRAAGGVMDSQRDARLASIRGKFNQYWGGAQDAMLQFAEGAKTSGDGAMKIMGPILEPLSRALSMSGADMGEVAIPMSDEDRVNQALLGDAGMGDDGVKQTKHRRGAARVVNMALSQVGNKAKGSEPNKYSRGRAEWWCMDFVGWAYEQIGYSPWGAFTDSMWGTYTYKGYKGIEAWARDNGYWRDPQGYVPRPGDVFFLERWSGATPGEGAFVGEHVGMVVDVMEDGTLLTVEGNAVQNGVNGVWQHRRDPSRSIFRGFATTKIAGQSTASMAARQKYIEKTKKNHERRKKNIAKQKLVKATEKAALDAKVNAEATARGASTGYSQGELMSSVSSGPRITAKATASQDASGPLVTVEVDLSGVDFSAVQIDSGNARAGFADAQREVNSAP